MSWVPTSRSLKQLCELCSRLSLKGPWVPLRCIVAICMSWTLSRRSCRSLAWLQMTGIRLSKQIKPQVLLLWDCKMDFWANARSDWLILLTFDSSFRNTATSNWGGAFYTRKFLSKDSCEALFQVVLPAGHRETALKECHDEVGHMGLEQMLDLMHDHFFWLHMAVQVKKHREYVVERQPYPNLPVYVVCPRDGEGTANPTSELPVTHQLAGQLKDKQKAYLTCWQNSTNQSTQSQLGQPPQAWWMMNPRLVQTNLFHLGKLHIQWGANSQGGTRISHCSKITPLPVPSIWGMVPMLVCILW